MKQIVQRIQNILSSVIKRIWGSLNNSGNVLRKIKIQYRLIAAFLILSLLPLILMGVISYSRSNQAISERIEKYSIGLIYQTSKILETELSKYEQTVREVGYLDSIQDEFTDMRKATKDELLTHAISIDLSSREKFSPYDEIIETGFITGEDIDQYLLKNAKNFTDDDIKRISESAKAAKGAPVWLLVHTVDGYSRLVTAREINNTKAGGKVGVILAAITTDHFMEAYKSVDLGEGSELFMLDAEGTVLTSRNDDIPLNEKYSDLSILEMLKSNREQDIPTFDFNGCLVTYSYMKNNDWNVVAMIPYSYINAGGKAILTSVIVLFVICVLISTLLSFIVSSSISVPLKQLVNIMHEAKSGNLALSLHDSSRDEIAMVTRNFDDMLANIRNLVTKVRQSSVNLIGSIGKIKTSSESTHSVSEQIATTMQEIAKGTSEQAEEVAYGVDCANKLADGINKVGENVTIVSEFISNTKDLSENGLAVVRLLKKKATQTNDITKKVADDVQSLNIDMKQIKKIVNAIGLIAEQTNMLALNATIEAARAGEAGKGFSVVATEVKKLADKSKESSAMINSIINNIQEKTDNTAVTAETGSKIVNEQMEAVNSTDEAFKNIYSSMDNIIENMNNMRDSVADMNESKDDTIKVMDNISSVSQQAAATSQEVSASTQEQMSGAEELAQLAEGLDEMAQELKSAIALFKIE